MSWFRYIDALSSVANPGQRRENQPIEPGQLEVPKTQQGIRVRIDRSSGLESRLSVLGAVNAWSVNLSAS
jgi:hypothetical protein